MGIAISLAPRERKAWIAGKKEGSSINTISPGLIKARATRSIPCCAPETIMISEGWQKQERFCM